MEAQPAFALSNVSRGKITLSTKERRLAGNEKLADLIYPTFGQPLYIETMNAGPAPIVKPIVVAHFGPKIKKTFHYTESETTMHALRSLLRSVFNFPHGTTDDQISIKTKADGAFLLSDEALRRAVTPKFEIVVETAQIAFSDWKYSQVKSLFGISADTFQDLPEFKAEYFDISDRYSKAAIKHIMEDLRRRLISFSASPVMNEATSREFISCILSGITSCYDGDIKLFPEYKVAGSHGKGPLDWAIKKGDTIIGVTEAKRLDMEQGVAQNLVQLQTSAQLNKSKRAKDEDDLEMIYGIVTTGYYWVILRLIVNGGEVQVHKSNCKCIQLLLDVDNPDKDQVAVENLVRQIRWLLEEQILIHTLPKFEKRRRLSQDSNP